MDAIAHLPAADVIIQDWEDGNSCHNDFDNKIRRTWFSHWNLNTFFWCHSRNFLQLRDHCRDSQYQKGLWLFLPGSILCSSRISPQFVGKSVWRKISDFALFPSFHTWEVAVGRQRRCRERWRVKHGWRRKLYLRHILFSKRHVVDIKVYLWSDFSIWLLKDRAFLNEFNDSITMI